MTTPTTTDVLNGITAETEDTAGGWQRLAEHWLALLDDAQRRGATWEARVWTLLAAEAEVRAYDLTPRHLARTRAILRDSVIELYRAAGDDAAEDAFARRTSSEEEG
ncbi:MAG: hypothetical protein Q8S13_01640 [Dehalococcoidia bacterium]|nr:hypothetical protein [Dehalococcoidia bacterium]